MHKQLQNYFEAYNLFSQSQHGSRSGKSTTSAVMDLVNKILQAFDDKESVAISLKDLSKAYDCIPPGNVIIKLEFYGVTPEACKIIESYFSKRRQYVVVNGRGSTVRIVILGMPQGSVLAPFLFIVDINDLPEIVGVDSILYIDDSTFF